LAIECNDIDNGKWNIVFTNDIITNKLRFSKTELIGIDVKSLIQESDKANFISELNLLLNQDKVSSNSYKIVFLDKLLNRLNMEVYIGFK